MKQKHMVLYLKGLLMGAVDIIPGLSGGTMALITGIYEELIRSINQFDLKKISLLRQKGVLAFWQAINGSFLFPLSLGVLSGILFLSSTITYLITHHAILIWAFFFGLIIASIIFLLRQLEKLNFMRLLLFTFGAVTAYSITQLTPSGTSNSLVYLFLCSMIAIIAMILPGISGAFLFILLGVYEEVLNTIKGAIGILFNFNWHDFQSIYSKVAVIGLGILIGLKLFSKVLSWLFTHKKEQTLALLIGFMLGALPKIWPWKSVQLLNGKEQLSNISPLNYEGEPQLALALGLMLLGGFVLFLIERLATKK